MFVYEFAAYKPVGKPKNNGVCGGKHTCALAGRPVRMPDATKWMDALDKCMYVPQGVSKTFPLPNLSLVWVCPKRMISPTRLKLGPGKVF